MVEGKLLRVLGVVGVLDARRVAVHVDDHFCLAADLSVVERPHADRDLKVLDLRHLVKVLQTIYSFNRKLCF